jgi:hypothetical protein
VHVNSAQKIHVLFSRRTSVLLCHAERSELLVCLLFAFGNTPTGRCTVGLLEDIFAKRGLPEISGGKENGERHFPRRGLVVVAAERDNECRDEACEVNRRSYFCASAYHHDALFSQTKRKGCCGGYYIERDSERKNLQKCYTLEKRVGSGCGLRGG